MPDSGEAIGIRIVDRAAAVAAADWDACAGGANPFLSHAFFHALEESGSAATRAGWRPQHVVAGDETGSVVGIVPLYVKAHSYGEYVFDRGWAEAFDQAGGKYYPKLQVAVPFTPVPGPRLLARGGAPAVRGALIQALAKIAEQSGVSSLHVTFCTADEAQSFAESGFLIRHGCQYHWNNRGYASFDDFLAALSHSKRKAIRKERRAVADSGATLRALSGADLKPAHWDAFFDFYIATSEGKWGRPYLTREFFHRLGAGMAERVVLIMAERDGRPIAGALNLRGRDTLYGRNWGCREEVRFLHFEACYYQAIDYAIAHKLARVEAGAQGEHKIQRGYLPQPTYSAHWIRDAGFKRAVADFLRRETRAMREEMEMLGMHTPFKENTSEK
jgi:hypothetical protein